MFIFTFHDIHDINDINSSRPMFSGEVGLKTSSPGSIRGSCILRGSGECIWRPQGF